MGITPPKQAPATILATTSVPSPGTSAETRPASAAPSRATRITRSRPNRSDSTPHIGCDSP